MKQKGNQLSQSELTCEISFRVNFYSLFRFHE